MEALEYIWIDEDSVSNVLGASSSSSSSKTPFFPSLSSLRILECPKLKGWWRNSDDNEPHHLLLPSFPPSLSKLHISNCPNLTSMPPFPYFKERLFLGRCSWKVMEQTMKMKMGAATTSTYFPPLSQLQELDLQKMNDIESLPEDGLRNLVSLRKLQINRCDGLSSLHWIGSLTSLQTLVIAECHNLTSLPEEGLQNLVSLQALTIVRCGGLSSLHWIGSLTSLQTLQIERCPNLTSLPQEIRNLTSLKELGIWHCPLTSLPQEIRNLTSLNELKIWHCPLTSLPQEIGSLTSLQTLGIWSCPNLTSLPQEISNLTSLKELEIRRCPLLGQRCKRQIGEDWPFIAHVPRVLVDGWNQQEETISSEPCDAEPSEAKNKLGYKIRTLFKTCNCATGQELSES